MKHGKYRTLFFYPDPKGSNYKEISHFLDCFSSPDGSNVAQVGEVGADTAREIVEERLKESKKKLTNHQVR